MDGWEVLIRRRANPLKFIWVEEGVGGGEGGRLLLHNNFDNEGRE